MSILKKKRLQMKQYIDGHLFDAHRFRVLICSPIEVLSSSKHLVNITQLLVAHTNLIETPIVRLDDATIKNESFRIERDVDAEIFGIACEIVPFVDVDLVSPVRDDLQERFEHFQIFF